MQEIKSLDEIKVLVDTFYGKVREDDMLAEIFEARVQGRWEVHLEKMYTFWQTVLLEEHTYRGRPFPPHMQLPIEKEHFECWLSLFHETVDSLFTGEKANEAKWRAGKMAEMFYAKITYIRNSSSRPIL